MSFHLIESELKHLAQTPDMVACALVDLESGILYSTTAKSAQFELMAESVRDYWSLHQRNRNVYSALGELRHVFLQHRKGILCLQQCGNHVLLIGLAKSTKTAWGDWMQATAPLQELVEKYLPR